MTAAAMLLPPYNEFFKVGVSSAGNHDNNIYNQNWSEQHHGLREVPVNPAAVRRGGSSGSGSGGLRPPAGAGTGATQGGETGGMQGGGGQGGGAGTGLQGGGSNQGSTEQSVATRFEIRVPANHELAANLKGRLLLVHGEVDNNVHPAGTLRLVNALIRAGKRFDFMLLPGQAHGFGQMQEYFTRMMFEYFAEHLLGDYYRANAEIAGLPPIPAAAATPTAAPPPGWEESPRR